MTQLSYSFCMAMLHSLWQAALLVLFYFILDKALLLKNTSPLGKRNLLFIIITTQLALFITTFAVYFFTAETTTATANITEIVTG